MRAFPLLLIVAFALPAEDTFIRVNALDPGRPVSRFLTGACIEDVNHEIYGGIYSQMLFGESFQEPPRNSPIKNFNAFEGDWQLKDNILDGSAGNSPKLISSTAPFAGETGVEVFLPGNANGNAGLIVNVARPGIGADRFDGYEISLDAAAQKVRLGRHQQNFKLLKEAPCVVPADQWIPLVVKTSAASIEILVSGKSVLEFTDPQPLKIGTVGLRQWQRPARYRNLWINSGDQRTEIPFEQSATANLALSGMWSPVRTGTAQLQATLETAQPFIGTQSQRITFSSGTGEVGIENEGLNRWGLSFESGKIYEGYVWLRAEKSTDVTLALCNRTTFNASAETTATVSSTEWRRYDFTLTPKDSESAGSFAIKLKDPGSVVIGHAFLQAGPWGRFKNLPVRRDVAEALINQGCTVLRYGGSMVNAPEYRWKKMIGPRDRRPPYKGTWYAHSSNGWGILDFLNLCEAANSLAITVFNIDESPQDMADFIDYANAPADSVWGRKRAADGHPQPYNLKHIELGNEERVDQAYFEKFAALAKAVWAHDPNVILVVGDFAYNKPIADPMNFSGADSKITSLAAHQKILSLARQNDREVWFDVHVWTEAPGASASLIALPSYITALEKLASGAKHHVAVFELNANNPRQRRALSNAQAIGTLERDGRLPVVTSANSLQPDGQNDNGWDQGLLFLNQSQTWLQPPGYVTQMISKNFQPIVLNAEIKNAEKLDITATRSDDSKTIVLRIVNIDDKARTCSIHLDNFTPSKPAAQIETLSGPLDAMNTAAHPTQIAPIHSEWRHEMKDGTSSYSVQPHSFTIIRFE